MSRRRDAGFWLGLRAVRWLARWPDAAREALFALVALGAWAVMPGLRRRVRARLEAGLGFDAGARRALGAFRTAGGLVADTLALANPRERAGLRMIVAAPSRRAFTEALATRKGVVFITGHLGPWERMAAVLAEEGFPASAVAAMGSDPRVATVLETWRGPRGVRAFDRGRASQLARAVRELDEGRAVGFLVDLPSRRRGVPTELFGARFEAPFGPFRLARERGAEVVVGSPVRGERGVLEVDIERVRHDDLPAGREGAIALQRRCLAILDRRIRSWPEGWLGLYVEGALGGGPSRGRGTDVP